MKICAMVGASDMLWKGFRLVSTSITGKKYEGFELV